MTVSGGSGLSPEEVERMTRDAAEHSREDEAARVRAREVNDLEAVVLAGERFLSDSAEVLPVSDMRALAGQVATLRAALRKADLSEARTLAAALPDVISSAKAKLDLTSSPE